MHKFEYKNQVRGLYKPEIISAIESLGVHKGKQELYLDTKPEVLEDMLKFAINSSAISSNRIEGIQDPDAEKVLEDKMSPVSRSQKEISAYRSVLNTIHESHEFIPIKPSVILQLHKDMYKGVDVSFCGQYKTSDNIIQEIDAEGNKRVRFYTVPAVSTETAVNEMCECFNEAWEDPYINKLLLSMMFVLDFLCIHPFIDGNGRLSRLLTILLLYRSGYVLGKYISIEKLIEDSKKTYYESLKLSSDAWHENKNNYEYFVDYMLGVVTDAYDKFETRIDRVNDMESKPEVVESVMADNLCKITKQEIREQCPGISDITIQRALSDLQKRNKIEKIGGGRYTYYVTKF